MLIRTGCGRAVHSAIASIVLTCLAVTAQADQWSDERQAIDEKFAEELSALAQRCDELGLEREAELTRSWQVRRSPGRIYIFLPPASGPAAVGDEGSPTRYWSTHFLDARRAHAERLFQLAKKVARE